MVRESRLLWNDADEHHTRHWPVDDGTTDEEDAPLEPPPKRRCNRRGLRLGRNASPPADATNPSPREDAA